MYNETIKIGFRTERERELYTETDGDAHRGTYTVSLHAGDRSHHTHHIDMGDGTHDEIEIPDLRAH